MNKAFIKKMIKAKRLEYEAFLELAPQPIRDGLQVMKQETMEAVKEFAWEYYCEARNQEASQKTNVAEAKEARQEEKAQKSKKIKVEFN